jgi:hypothetical protein
MADQTAPDNRLTAHTFLFEVKGIQKYVFDSGSLRDVVGASDLVAGLVKSPAASSGADAGDSAPDLIDLVINAADPAQDTQRAFSRRASGAFCLHSNDKTALDEIRALWRLAIQLRCPGLEMTEGTAEGRGRTWDQAALASIESAHDSISGIRENHAAAMPPTGGPIAQFVRRTGRPATAVVLHADEEEFLDAMTAPQRPYADRPKEEKRGGVASRFLSADLRRKQPPYVFPRNIDRRVKEDEDNPLFPFRNGEDTRLAVIHADISGLGQTYRLASKRALKLDQMLELSKAIERAVEGAAQAATQQILIRAASPWEVNPSRQTLLPARPIVLGGDDFTILVRADLALPFAAALLTEIEKRTEAELKRFPELDVPPFLSACAGVAIVRRGQPFLMALEIADGLCRTAKREAKRNRPDGKFPSGIAFHFVGSTMQEHYDDILQNEMTAETAGQKLILTANPYWLGDRRNDVVHAQYRPSGEEAASITQTIKDLVEKLRRAKPIDAEAADGACFVNLSNHPSEKWEDAQAQAARDLAKPIKDIGFPPVPPDADEKTIGTLAKEWAAKVPPETTHALVQGEFTLTFELVRCLQARGITCLAATTTRNVVEEANGRKVSSFAFVRFRAYPELGPT